MPIGTARKLQDKVDKNRDGEISASEIGELFRDLEEGEEKISHLRGALVLAVIFLGASIAANLGTSVQELGAFAVEWCTFKIFDIFSRLSPQVHSSESHASLRLAIGSIPAGF